MHRPMQDIGPRAGESDSAKHESQQQQDHIHAAEAQDDALVGHEADDQHRRYREADGGQHRTHEDIHRALQLVRERRPLQSHRT